MRLFRMIDRVNNNTQKWLLLMLVGASRKINCTLSVYQRHAVIRNIDHKTRSLLKAFHQYKLGRKKALQRNLFESN